MPNANRRAFAHYLLGVAQGKRLLSKASEIALSDKYTWRARMVGLPRDEAISAAALGLVEAGAQNTSSYRESRSHWRVQRALRREHRHHVNRDETYIEGQEETVREAEAQQQRLAEAFDHCKSSTPAFGKRSGLVLRARMM
jgi:hypothetical protein